MPMASAATAVIVKLGLCRKMRSECLRSLRKDFIRFAASPDSFPSLCFSGLFQIRSGLPVGDILHDC